MSKCVPKTSVVQEQPCLHLGPEQFEHSDFEFLQCTETERHIFSFLKGSGGNYKSDKIREQEDWEEQKKLCKLGQLQGCDEGQSKKNL